MPLSKEESSEEAQESLSREVRACIDPYLDSIEDISDIKVNFVTHVEFVKWPAWYALDYANQTLKQYDAFATVLEKENLSSLPPLIAELLNDPKQALSKAPNLIAYIRNWLNLEDLRKVNGHEALHLLKANVLLLKSLLVKFNSSRWIRMLVPSATLKAIDELLALAKVKQSQLLAHIANPRKLDSPKAPNARQKLVELISTAFHTLKDKTENIAEQQETVESAISELRKLANCFKEKDVMKAFWRRFNTREAFDSLCDHLKIDGSEKEAWLSAFDYHMKPAATPSSLLGHITSPLSTAYSSTVNYLTGTQITASVLKAKFEPVVDSLFDILVERHPNLTDVSDKLKFIHQYYQRNAARNITNHIEGLLPYLRFDKPVVATKVDAPLDLTKLKKTLDKIRPGSFRALRLYRRALLIHLKHIKQYREDLLKEKQTTLSYLNTIKRLAAASQDPFFQLSGYRQSQVVPLCQQALKEVYLSLCPEDEHSANYTEPRHQEQMIVNIKKRYDQIQEMLNTAQPILKQFYLELVKKGEATRRQALVKLEAEVSQRNVFKEFFFSASSHYHRCMKLIKAALKDPEITTLRKVITIINILNEPAESSGSLVQNRLQGLKDAYSPGFFTAIAPGQKLPRLPKMSEESTGLVQTERPIVEQPDSRSLSKGALTGQKTPSLTMISSTPTAS